MLSQSLDETFTTIRVRKNTIERVGQWGKFGDTIDGALNRALDEPEHPWIYYSGIVLVILGLTGQLISSVYSAYPINQLPRSKGWPILLSSDLRP